MKELSCLIQYIRHTPTVLLEIFSVISDIFQGLVSPISRIPTDIEIIPNKTQIANSM